MADGDTTLNNLVLTDSDASYSAGQLKFTDANGNTYTAMKPSGFAALRVNLATVDTSSTTAYTLADDEPAAAVDSNGAAATITIPTAQNNAGQMVYVLDSGGNASTNAITVDTEGSETIDGGGTVSIGTNYGQLTFMSDGSNWFTV